jgi:ribulose-5-phosphate 4-epimerase/fuculose-1-phosphate aldolase
MDLREELVWAGNEMVRRGLTVYTAGNISVRTQDGTGFYIKPSSQRYCDIHPADLVMIDWEGTPVSGSRPPSIEHHMHRLIYLARPDAQAIVHTHSRYATTLATSAMRCGIPAALGEIIYYLGGPIPLAEYAPSGSMQLAQNAVRCLGPRNNGILLKNHGALAIGQDLRQAIDFAEIIERGAESFVLAQLLGGYDQDPESYRMTTE